jgi:hypothetical protein
MEPRPSAVIGPSAEDWDFPTKPRGMACHDEMRMMEGLFCVTDRRILRINLSNLQQLFPVKHVRC